MKKYLIPLIILTVIVVYGVSQYNTLVIATTSIDAQRAQVDSVLQRRFDAINQAIGSLKISNKSEQDALQKITDARKIYMAAAGDTEAQVAQANNYAGALNGLLLARSTIGEQYPNLKTPDLVGWLIEWVNIEGNENRINVERMRYNDLVKDYNIAIMKIPWVVFAKIFGFNERSYFELANAEATQAPAIGQNLEF